MPSPRVKKIGIAVLAAGLIGAFFAFGLGRYTTLDHFQASQAQFTELYAARPVLVIGVYMGVYILVTALSLPGAAVLSLAGGALFGLFVGTLVVSFASTLGATLACAFSRFLLRDWVRSRLGRRLEAVNRGMDREGAFYLFSLRLVPAFPFWMINLAMGLTTIPLFTFYWVSQVGMLPGTLVFINAGKELAKIDSLSGILSPGLIASFILLGLFPITVKKLLAFHQKKTGLPKPEQADAPARE